MIRPVAKPRPAAGATTLVMGERRDNAVAIYVLESVLEQILEYSERDVQRELGGFLVGGYHMDETPYVEVRYFLEAVDSHSDAASLTFTHETWASMTRDVTSRFPDELVLGWHHTHPQLHVFLSGYDLFIHRHFFRQPWQIAMVVDPVCQEFGFFQWQGDRVIDCGFTCVRGR